MGRQKKVRKVRKAIKKSDERLKQNVPAIRESEKPKKKETIEELKKLDGVSTITEIPSVLFFKANLNLGPPYRIILDTNFINFSIQHKIDIFKGLMDCLIAKCIPIVTDCIVGELEKMGHRFRLALRVANDPRVERLTCTHKGTYADDCIVNRVTDHRCYIVGTSDRDLKQRIRKIPGVPIIFVTKHKYMLERLPDCAI